MYGYAAPSNNPFLIGLRDFAAANIPELSPYVDALGAVRDGVAEVTPIFVECAGFVVEQLTEQARNAASSIADRI